MNWMEHYQQVEQFVERNQVQTFEVTTDTVGPVLFARHRTLNPKEYAGLVDYLAWIKTQIDAEGLEGDMDSP